jgi:nitroreductase
MNKGISAEQSAQFLQGRRSIRLFEPSHLSETCIRQLLEAAMAAPSAVAKDPWRFVVVQQQATIEKLAAVLSNGQMLLTARNAIAVCGDLETAHDRQLSYLLQDCSAAIENLLLAAHGQGLGACWLGVHPREARLAAVKAILGLPEFVIPVGCVALGKPGETKEARTRYKAEYVHWEKW